MEEEGYLARARSGNADAFEALVTPYERQLYAVCLRMLGTPADAQDALQETMLRLWRGLGAFEARAQFGSWAYRVASNVCLDALRKRKLRAVDSLETLQEAGFVPADPGETPAEALERAERGRLLRQALAELPPEARAALVLRDLQGESYEAVAAALGVSMGTAKSRIHRAREKIAKLLLSNAELFAKHHVQSSEGREAP